MLTVDNFLLVKSDKILAKWRKLTLTKIKIDKIFTDKVSNSGLSFKFCWFWIFPWIKLYWRSCSMWDKPGWLNWFRQHLSEVIFLNLKGFLYSYAWPHNLCKGLLFAQDLSLKNSADSLLCFQLPLLHSVS